MTAQRRTTTVLLLGAALLAATALAYALTFGADLTVTLPRLTIAGRPVGGEVGWRLPGLRGGVAVAALVNGRPIYWSQVDAQVAQAAAQFGLDFSGERGRAQRRQIERVVLDQLVNQELILQAARRRGLVATDAEVAEEVRQVTERLGGEEAFRAALAQRGLTMAEVRRILRLNLTVRKLRPAVTSVQVTEAEVRQAFERRRAEYDRPEQVRVSHILARAESPQRERAALAKIRLVQARLQRGEAFADLARRFSDDPGSREAGGHLGFVSRGTLVPEFERAAFALPPGQVSEPVRSPFGYHLILVHERQPARRATYAEARAQVRARLIEERQEAAFRRWLEAERRQAAIRRFDRPTS